MVTDGSALPLRFDNFSLRALPGDPSDDVRRRQVHNAMYSQAAPTPVSAPYVVAWSKEMAELLGLDERHVESSAFAQVFSGNALLEGMVPTAARYGGHQFGSWAGQLGDGRAISLGEAVARDGQRWELQLKGAGPTPYSRMGDGRAVLRSSVREFLCSEAMHYLGVPTTRALSLVGTGDLIERDILYSGDPKLEPGAIVCRAAPTFLRFGSYELPARRGETDLLRTLVEYTIDQYYSPLKGRADRYTAFYNEVCQRSAALVAHWQRVGFVHGVLNTDNMSIIGLTIDYGPYGWLDDYNPDWTPNTTDAVGKRYRFGWQPAIVGWNLARLGEALLPLVQDEAAVVDALEGYRATVGRLHRSHWLAKLGLSSDGDTFDSAVDTGELLDELDRVLQLHETDMTLFFRRLADVDVSREGLSEASDEALVQPLMDAFYQPSELTGAVMGQVAAWMRRYVRRSLDEHVSGEPRRTQMNRVNPKYVLRNYLAQLAIDRAEQGDASLVRELLDVLREPYAENPTAEQYAQKRPDWARNRPGCSMLSCSS